MSDDATRARYGDDDVADFYARHAGLQDTERLLFDAYARPGLDVLDVGVGGGRTAARLARDARGYVGVDYSEAMVRRCRTSFPSLRFEVVDATRMPLFADASFDLCVFSFNGIDSIPTLEGRRDCLRECARVLRPGGVLLFSVHNARYLVFAPVFTGARGWKRAWRLAYAAGRTLRLLAVRLTSRAFWNGAGYARDPGTHGGLVGYMATPERQVEELRACGLEVERVVPAPFPQARWTPGVGWYYYACRKPGAHP